MAAEMTLREHIEELRGRILRIVVSVVIITIFVTGFDLRPIDVGNFVLAYPFPDPLHNIASRLMLYMQHSLLPEGVKLVQTAPGQAFFAQIYVSALIGVIGSIPIIIREISAFISPAISNGTKAGITHIFVPAVALFAAGIVFSYLIVIPFILNFLYEFGRSLDILLLFTINDFISFILQFLLGFGIAFQLPILMYGLSLTDAISPKFWRDNFRYALIVLVIFGAAITPDGSGITMWFVTGPMTALYVAGMVIVERRARRIRQASSITKTNT
jgi:sec-independent protein translocase protein TatC